MDFLRLFSVYFIRYIYRLKHRKIETLNLILLPLILVFRNLLTGIFVKDIELYNTVIPYFYFLIISMALGDIFNSVSKRILQVFHVRNRMIEMLYYGYKDFILGRVLWLFVNYSIFYLPIILFALILLPFNLVRILLTIPAMILLVVPALALGFLISPLIIKFRGREARIVRDIISHLSWFLVPTTFSLLVFSEKIRVVQYILPSIGIVEEIRRFAFTGKLNLILLLLYIVISLLYLVAGFLVFIKALDYARRKGWIGLQ